MYCCAKHGLSLQETGSQTFFEDLNSNLPSTYLVMYCSNSLSVIQYLLVFCWQCTVLLVCWQFTCYHCLSVASTGFSLATCCFFIGNILLSLFWFSAVSVLLLCWQRNTFLLATYGYNCLSVIPTGFLLALSSFFTGNVLLSLFEHNTYHWQHPGSLLPKCCYLFECNIYFFFDGTVLLLIAMSMLKSST
jgi:hypothetical protein